MGRGPYAAVCGGDWRPPGPNFAGDPGVPWDHELAHDPKFHLHGLDPLRGSRTIKILASTKFQGRPWWTDSEVLNLLLAYSSVMSSKLTEITESSPSAPPPSVLHGSCVFSRLSSPSMASSGHSYPSHTYEGYRAVEILDPDCTECLAKGKDCFQNYNPQYSKCHYCFIGKKTCCRTGVPSSNVRRYLWSRNNEAFGKEFPFSHAPTPDGTSGYSHFGGRPIYSSSEVPISRINTEGAVKRIRRIDDSPTDPDAEGSDELDGEEFEVVPHLVGHPSSNSSPQPLANRFQIQVIPSTPRTFQLVLASIPTTIPPSSPSTSHARPALNPAVRPSPSQQPRNSPITTSCQLQPVACSSRRRDGLSPFPFAAAQGFQRRDCWPI
ncbi:hypothetical protein O181_049447 [Austropuccinia psidii MF-1]|uniref:Uncharacterized protein n=1 Tax=Austropuccinia psidii MF-1 TaxID=1389203 RepID=A0A9Q3E1T9_9BASI|nr:hypothetical protein [Austropuccinia psidii MF-1]